MQTLCTDYAQTAVGISQYQNSIRLNGSHQLIALSNDISHGFSKVSTDCIHIHFRVCQLQIMEKYTVQVIIIILPRMCQNHIKIFTCFVDNSCQTNNLRTSTDNNQQLQLSIIFKRYITIIRHYFSPLTLVQKKYPDDSDQRSHCRS